MKGLWIGIVISAASSCFAQSAPPTAEQLIRSGELTARAEHKNVMIDFSASWCPWCVQFNKLFHDPHFGPIFEKDYVLVEITIVETPAKKGETNLGWEKAMAKYRPTKDQDIPYIVILSPRGQKLGDSYEPAGQRIPGNAGFPQTPAEIDQYMALLKKTAPHLTNQDMTDLKAYFEKVRAVHKH